MKKPNDMFNDMPKQKKDNIIHDMGFCDQDVEAMREFHKLCDECPKYSDMLDKLDQKSDWSPRMKILFAFLQGRHCEHNQIEHTMKLIETMSKMARFGKEEKIDHATAN